MRFNNRMPKFEPSVFEKLKTKHRVIKNGVAVFVEGDKPDPYKDIPASSLTLQSRIDSGTFEDHEGKPHPLEKASASDMINDVMESAIAETSSKNTRVQQRKDFADMQERGRKALERAKKERDND